MFGKALITCTACRVPGIGSTAVFGGTTCCMTGSDRGGYNDRSPRVAQFSLKPPLKFLHKHFFHDQRGSPAHELWIGNPKHRHK